MNPTDLDAMLSVLRKHGVTAYRDERIQVAFGAPVPTAAEKAAPDAVPAAVRIVRDGDGNLIAELDPDLHAAV